MSVKDTKEKSYLCASSFFPDILLPRIHFLVGLCMQLASTTGFSQAEASNQRLRERCESYRKEICETRAARDAEIIKDLSIKESIVKTWNQLKAVRVR